jgi:hypothetical protein
MAYKYNGTKRERTVSSLLVVRKNHHLCSRCSTTYPSLHSEPLIAPKISWHLLDCSFCDTATVCYRDKIFGVSMVESSALVKLPPGTADVGLRDRHPIVARQRGAPEVSSYRKRSSVIWQRDFGVINKEMSHLKRINTWIFGVEYYHLSHGAPVE